MPAYERSPYFFYGHKPYFSETDKFSKYSRSSSSLQAIHIFLRFKPISYTLWQFFCYLFTVLFTRCVLLCHFMHAQCLIVLLQSLQFTTLNRLIYSTTDLFFSIHPFFQEIQVKCVLIICLF